MSKCRPASLDLDACSCCLAVAKSSPVLRSPTLAHLWDKLLVAERLESILAQPQQPPQQQQQPSSPPSTPLLKILRDPRLLAASGLGSQPGEQTLLAILLFFHSASGASVVAIDNKIEQAMDLVKSHLMYAVREEVEVLKEQIKELIEKNSQLEQENRLLKSLASPEQLQQIQSQIVSVPSGGGGAQPSTPGGGAPAVGAVAAPPAAAAPVTAAPSATALPSV